MKIENNKSKIIKEYEFLKEKIILWNKTYFDYNDPIVKDHVYDASLEKLKQYESKYKYLNTSNSPTLKIGATVNVKFSKVKHQVEMLSLNKAYKLEDLKAFEKQINKLGFFPNYFLELKIDGLSVALKYKKGKLIQALTRGDGIIGEDVTENVYQIEDIPKNISYQNSIEIRGEIYLSKSNFYKINEKQKKLNQNIFANPRNAASGTLRQLDAFVVKKRNLNSFLYSIVDPLKHKINNFDEQIKFLENNNFKISNLNKFSNSIELAYQYIKDFEKTNIRETLDYEIDGIVIKVNDFSIYDTLGQTSKFPKSMIAFKFSDITVETKLLDIFATVGRTGKITYNAKLEPIIINGTLVSAATLHNYDYVKELNLNINDNVKVIKAGEIIPKVISLSQKNSTGVLNKIVICPSCKTKLVNLPNEVDQYCINENCLMIILKKIEHFVSRKAMNIFGLGYQIIEKFFILKILRNYVDLFTLEKHQKLIESQYSFGKKSYENLIKSIDNSKLNTLDKFIFALGIKHVGQRASKLIANEIKELSNILNYDFDLLENIRDISIKTIDSLKKFFSNQHERKNIEKILALNLNFKKEVIESKSGIFKNQNFVITGTLSKPRDFFKNIILKNSGNVTNVLSNKTNFLLIGENPGSKINKAKKMNNISIINENEFNKLIKI